jgi:hypothetical protein
LQDSCAYCVFTFSDFCGSFLWIELLLIQVFENLQTFCEFKLCLFLIFDQVELANKLPHVQSLCIHEMVVRAFKHILQAVIASVERTSDLAASIAAALNIMLGTPSNKNGDQNCISDSLKWKWVELFLSKRFGWKINNFNRQDLRKFAILRGLCHKVAKMFVRILLANSVIKGSFIIAWTAVFQ